MNIVFLYLALQSHVLYWDPRPSAEHVAYNNVYMQISSTVWWRMGSSKGGFFVLPVANAVRTFAVTSVPDESLWPFPESGRSLPITTHL